MEKNLFLVAQAATLTKPAGFFSHVLSQWGRATIFLFLIFCAMNGSGQEVFAQQNFQILDRFGNQFTIDQIAVEAQRPPISCDGAANGITTGGSFDYELFFNDPANTGLNDAAYAAHRTVICQVFRDLSYLIQASPTCTGNKPVLRIAINPSIFAPAIPGQPQLLGTASAYFFNYTNTTQTQTGYAYGNVWRTINGGEDNTQMPYLIGNNLIHGYFYLNLSVNWNTNLLGNFANSPGNPDLYQATLHEVCHMLGIHSWINTNGSSLVSNPTAAPNGLYTAFDRFLRTQNTPNANLLTNINGCDNVQYTAATNLPTGGCDQVQFKGSQDPALLLPIYTPTDWASGSSMSHFGNTTDGCTTTPYLMHWKVMNGTNGFAIRRPTDVELKVLCEIGYQINNQYGPPNSPCYATVTGCGHRAAGVDDNRPHLNVNGMLQCDLEPYWLCDFPATINFIDLLANDVGINSAATIANACLENIYGSNLSLTQSGNTITINSAGPGLNIFSYTPIDAITGQALNPTWVYFTACLGSCSPQNTIPCNLICNSHINAPVSNCSDGSIFGNCNTLEAWQPFNGTPDIWTSNQITNASAADIASPNNVGQTINPPTQGVIGLTGHEKVWTGVPIVNNKSYLFSVMTMVPAQGTWNNIPSNVLPDMRVKLFTEANFNWNLATNPAILNALNMPQDGVWQQRIVCFNAQNDFTRLVIGRDDNLVNSYYFIDEVYLSEDAFPQAMNHINVTNCNEPVTIGEACSAIPNVLFQWETSTDNGTNWIPINGAVAGSYTINNTSDWIGCRLYRLTRYLNPNPAYPIVNAAALNSCINRTAIFEVCNANASCCLINAAPSYLQFNPSTNAVVSYGTAGATPHFTAPATTATWQSGSNPFNNAAGTAADPIRINGDVTIPAGADVTIQGLVFEFGLNGRIIVNQNARLALGTGTVMKGNPTCQSMWQGIRVKGPGETLKHTTNASGQRNFGIFEMGSTARMEDAIIGVAGMMTPLIPADVLLANFNQTQDLNTLSTLIMPAYTSTNVAHQTSGGVCRITGPSNAQLTFSNCFQGINLSWYPFNGTNIGGAAANGTSKVETTTFEATRTLWYPFSQLPTAAGTISEVGVVLNFYNNIEISKGCVMNNILYGVRAFGSNKLWVGNNTFSRTLFNDKPMVGVSVFNFQNSPVVEADVTIAYNDFNNLSIGMQCAGADLLIDDNDINPNGGQSYAGALLFGCTYTAKNNNIRSCYTGIASQADQNIPNLIKANTFDYCIAGTWARGDDTGLQIVCNDFDHYLTGIAMSNATLVAPEPGKLDDQGSCFDFDRNPADNLFLTGSNLPIFPDLLSNTTDGYIYYYRSGTDYQPTASANLNPILCTDVPESRAENCADFVLAANDVINIIEGTTQDQEMIKTIRRLVQVDHDTTAAVNLLATVNSRAAKRMALEYYIKKTMFNAAQQLLNSLPTTTQDDQFFKQLSTIKRDLAQSNRSIFELTIAEIATITNIANYRTRTSFEAQAILYLVQQREFPVQMEHLPAPLPAYTGTLPVVHFKNDATNTHLANAIKVLPNPTRDFVTVELPTTYSNATLSIYTIEGKLVLSQTLSTGVNTAYLQQIPTGLYYYLIETGNNLLQRDKLLIVK